MTKLPTLFFSFLLSFSLLQVTPAHAFHPKEVGVSVKQDRKKVISIFRKPTDLFMEFTPGLFPKRVSRKKHRVEKRKKLKRSVYSLVPKPTPVYSPEWEITFYAANDTGMNGEGITASGAPAQVGVTVAAPPNIPFGTKIYIPRFGWREVTDRGGAIYGDHLDVFVQNNSIAINLGVIYTKILICIPHQTAYWA